VKRLYPDGRHARLYSLTELPGGGEPFAERFEGVHAQLPQSLVFQQNPVVVPPGKNISKERNCLKVTRLVVTGIVDQAARSALDFSDIDTHVGREFHVAACRAEHIQTRSAKSPD
jgi:hypothetical protein